jgi:serine/threonine protein phosphatase 1
VAAGVHFAEASGPEGIRVYAIGDVHGRLDLLARMHRTIEEDMSGHPGKDWRIVHLGDYVDRGPDARGVIDFLIAAGRNDARVTSLAGNHDIGFMEFLVKPAPDELFAHNGGFETGLSYGVDLDFADPEGLRRTHRELLSAVPRSHVDFIGTLRLSLTMGDFFFCHAGIRPGIALESQDREDLIWIRGDFHRYRELHPKVIVHGHTPVGEPEVLPNRVNVDTGAF